MVNRGRPSRDCQPCRKRKLRCDLQRDRCGQCRRARITCSGWREPNALIIRDETAAVHQKALARQKFSLRVPVPPSWNDARPENSQFTPSCSATRALSAATMSGPSLATSVSPPSPLLTSVLHHPCYRTKYTPDRVDAATEDPETYAAVRAFMPPPYRVDTIPPLMPLNWEFQAREVFFLHYVFGFSRSHDALASLYASSPANSVLSSAVDAAGLAFFASLDRVPGYKPFSPKSFPSSLVQLARASYITSIKRLGTVLTAGDEALSDATLQAVLLLDLSEKLARTGINPTPDPLRISIRGERIDDSPWMSHMKGALTLVRLRSPRQRYASPAARRLVSRLAMALVVSSGAAGVRVPRELSELRSELAPYFGIPPLSEERGVRDSGRGGPDPKFVITGVVMDVVNLTADARENNLTPREILSRALELDQRFVEVEEGLPPTWRPERMILEDKSSMVYGDYYDVYVDHFVTQVRNVVRTMRLLLTELMRRHCVDEAGTELCHPMLTHTTDTMCADICASVPQFVWAEIRPDNCIPFTPLQSAQCYTLLAPLYIAGQLTNQEAMRSWIIGILWHVADCAGMSAAKSVGDILQYSPHVGYWEVYVMLGSYAFAA
ncbi:hypothetical protein F4778DRAFT_296376 [Xylariomycetidae sp. FL2044]|nr:hypothetical protein F4778DRAFT_296376 [Xylariomycetidae sp. FL2044]